MKYRHSMMLVYIALPLCVVLRLLQSVFTIEETTGFIKHQYSLISTLITVLIFITVAVVSLLAATTDGIKEKNTALKPGAAGAAMLAGGMFVYQTAAGFTHLSSGVWHEMLLVVLSVLSAAVFVAYGIKNIYEYKMPSIIMIVPALYYVVKLINIFISTSKLALVTENVFLIFTNSAVLLFMYELAALENDIGDAQKHIKKLFVCGLSSVLLCITTSLPKLALIIFTEKSYHHSDIAEALVNLSVAVFIFIYLLYNYSEKSEKSFKREPKHLA